MKKSDREIVFNKCGGHCSYCGDKLTDKWHVDHVEPVERKRKSIGGYYWKDTGLPVKDDDIIESDLRLSQVEFRKYKLVPDGFAKPENDTIENMMPACVSCNINKHSMNIEEFRAFIGRFIKSLNKSNTQYKVAKRYGLIEETGKEVKFYFETI